MLSVAEARAAILDGAGPLGAELAPLRQAAGRVLAEDLPARLTQPPFDTTAMDGYAVRAADAAAGVDLRVVGESAAGRRFSGALGPGEAVRIFTGAPLPEGADAVLRQEDARREGDRVAVLAPVEPGRFVRPAGLDFREGVAGLSAGRMLEPRALALAAAMGHALLPVRRKPRVAILPNGDELVPPGAPLGPDQIVASSVFSVAALLAEAGAELIELALAADDLATQRRRIAAARAAEADVLVTLGGASVGEHDLVREAFASEGVSLDFWRIAMRPGKPLVFGRSGAMRVVGLPGNPVSAYVCALVFLVPLLRALLGLSPDLPWREARLGADLRANDEREDYMRATLAGDVAIPLPVQDSSMQAALAAADGLLVRPPHAPASRAGEPVRVLPFAL
jgi:molybdopterin molybdotransferase